MRTALLTLGLATSILITSRAAFTTANVEGEIVVGNRTPLAFLLFVPSGREGRVRSSALIAAVSEQLANHTDLRLLFVEPNEAADCAGRLSCLVRKVRPDWDRRTYILANDTMAPYVEHLRYLQQKGIVYSPYVLIMSNLTGEATDRLTATFLDTDAALSVYHGMGTEQLNENEVEVRLLEQAVIAGPVSGELSSGQDAERFVNRLFAGRIQNHLTQAGHWKPYGSITVESSVGGAGVHLDGTLIGTTHAGRTRIRQVRAGRRALLIQHPGYHPHAVQVDVRQGADTGVKVELDRTASRAARGSRQGLMWGGAVVAATGLAFTIFALASAGGDVQTYCPTTAGRDCGGRRFVAFGSNPDAAPTFANDVNSGDFLIAPLGLGLTATGLGTLLLEDEGEFPWIPLLGGVALGGLTYGLSAALNPGDPFAR